MTSGTAPLRVGIAGLGTVGAGVLAVLRDNAEVLEARCGRPVTVTAVSARDRGKDRGISVSNLLWHADPVTLANDPAVDVVVELMGGSDGPARDLCLSALAAGKPVVTANKALLAEHAAELVAAAEAAGRPLRFEAAVAGGIPIVGGVRDGLAANRITRLSGILNGTCNFILTEMRNTGRDFADVLAEAQALGYAEADPTFDVDGIDAAHKLAILAGMAFGGLVEFGALTIDGIRAVTATDIGYAEDLGYRIILLGTAQRHADGIDLRVGPCLVPRAAPIASVEGVFNAVAVHGDFVDDVLMVGRGAGGGPTASAVVADLVDIARGGAAPALGQPVAGLQPLTVRPPELWRGAYYLRLMVRDQPGVIAGIAGAMRDHDISLESLIQRGRSATDAVPVVIVTHETTAAAMAAALAQIAALPAVAETPTLMRIETLHD